MLEVRTPGSRRGAHVGERRRGGHTQESRVAPSEGPKPFLALRGNLENSDARGRLRFDVGPPGGLFENDVGVRSAETEGAHARETRTGFAGPGSAFRRYEEARAL